MERLNTLTVAHALCFELFFASGATVCQIHTFLLILSSWQLYVSVNLLNKPSVILVGLILPRCETLQRQV